MKQNLRILAFLAFGSALASCAAAQKRQASENRVRSETFSKSLRIGMTKKELSDQGATPSNCRGNPKNIERCEVQFMTDYRGGLMGIAPTDYTSQKYETYTLTFDHEKLKMWDKQQSERLQSGSSK